MTSHVNSAVFTQNLAATCAGYPTSTDITVSVIVGVLMLISFGVAWWLKGTKVTPSLMLLASVVSIHMGTVSTYAPFALTKC